MEKQFEEKLQLWLEKVVERCNKLGEAINLDYYPFQCAKSSLKKNVDLLIIGANPGGQNPFKKRNTEQLFNSVDGINNAYIGEANNDRWKINKPILEIFKEPKLYSVLEKAIVMNTVYFGTVKAIDLSTRKEAIECCKELTKEFIYEIIRPKAVLVLGLKDAPNWLGIKYSTTTDSILRTTDNLTGLVMKVNYNNILHYIIHHTSMNFKFNSGENLDLKRKIFQKEFETILKF